MGSESLQSEKTDCGQKAVKDNCFGDSSKPNGNGVGQIRFGRSAHAEAETTRSPALKARVKITPSTASREVVKTEEGDDDLFFPPLNNKTALANINRRFSPNGDPKSGPASLATAGGSWRPLSSIPSRARTVFRASIEGPSAPEVATTSASNIFNALRLKEKETFSAPCEKSVSTKEDTSAHSLNPSARVRDSRNNDCDSTVHKSEGTPDRAPSASSLAGDIGSMASQVGESTAARSALFPNLVLGCKLSGLMPRDHENSLYVSDNESVQRSDSATVTVGRSSGGFLVANAAGGGQGETGKNNYSNDDDDWTKAVRSLDGDCSSSPVNHRDTSFSKSTSSQPSVLISNKPTNSAGDHPSTQASATLSFAPSKSSSTVGPSTDRSTVQNHNRPNMTKRPDDIEMRGRSGSYRARFPSPYHYQQAGHRFRQAENGNAVPNHPTWPSTARVRSFNDGNRKAANNYGLPFPSHAQESARKFPSQSATG